MVEPKKDEPSPLEARVRALEAENAQLKQSLSDAPTHMVKPLKISKPVKIRALCPIRVPNGVLPNGTIDFSVVQPGTEVTVDEDVAKEYCDREFPGQYSFSGERSTPTATRNVVKRAQRVA